MRSIEHSEKQSDREAAGGGPVPRELTTQAALQTISIASRKVANVSLTATVRTNSQARLATVPTRLTREPIDIKNSFRSETDG